MECVYCLKEQNKLSFPDSLEDNLDTVSHWAEDICLKHKSRLASETKKIRVHDPGARVFKQLTPEGRQAFHVTTLFAIELAEMYVQAFTEKTPDDSSSLLSRANAACAEIIEDCNKSGRWYTENSKTPRQHPFENYKFS